ncbi:hypothetical protein [Okeania sp. SIO2C9]
MEILIGNLIMAIFQVKVPRNSLQQSIEAEADGSLNTLFEVSASKW